MVYCVKHSRNHNNPRGWPTESSRIVLYWAQTQLQHIFVGPNAMLMRFHSHVCNEYSLRIELFIVQSYIHACRHVVIATGLVCQYCYNNDTI